MDLHEKIFYDLETDIWKCLPFGAAPNTNLDLLNLNMFFIRELFGLGRDVNSTVQFLLKYLDILYFYLWDDAVFTCTVQTLNSVHSNEVMNRTHNTTAAADTVTNVNS